MSKNWARDIAEWHQGHSANILADLGSMGLGLWDMYQKHQLTKGAGESGFAGSEAAQNAGLSVGEVVAITGCRSDQTSADVGDVHQQFHIAEASDLHGEHAGGALTAVFLESIEEGGASELTYYGLLERIRLRLRSEGFDQVPQLASSLVLELQQHFSLTTAFLPADPSKQAKGVGAGGFDLTDGVLIAGGGACAVGAFLSALTAHPHGESMHAGMFGASREAGSGESSSFLAGHAEGLDSWGAAMTTEEHPSTTGTAVCGGLDLEELGRRESSGNDIGGLGPRNAEWESYSFASQGATFSEPYGTGLNEWGSAAPQDVGWASVSERLDGWGQTTSLDCSLSVAPAPDDDGLNLWGAPEPVDDGLNAWGFGDGGGGGDDGYGDDGGYDDDDIDY
eukprot:NODE_5402_length_1775_cov_5.205097.p1 GENE.NODE_5402_length_1775_cov_5.205097~~NODE_5402_length_1775_cov_5.205097.p1  ORF type:complete len:419 (+),score=131.66 NODE_5402_length_1775_cov_5.205097:77-1258(+)